MNRFFNDKRVLVTGACGTVGRELVRQLLEVPELGELIGIDNNESELFFLEQRFLGDSRASFFLGDVRDRDRLCQKMEGLDIVFHTAAFKHVILSERAPYEAVQTNIIGVQNVIYAATECGVERVLFTSTDKAVNPTSVMGTSKLMGERLMTAANSNLRNRRPIFASTRFGNVLGSRGSVVPVFHDQIKRGGPITLTDPNMTRFIMSIQDAVRLVIDSVVLVRGGEVFITKMPVIRIKDLAEVMIEELSSLYGYKPSDIKIMDIGVKPGEKMYEELMSLEETRRAIELPSYFAVLPAFRRIYKNIEYNYPDIVTDRVENSYISASETPMSKEELRGFLVENDLLKGEVTDRPHPDRRYFPEER